MSQVEEQFSSSKISSVLPYQDVTITLLLYLQFSFQETVVKGEDSCGGIIDITFIQEKEVDFVSKRSPISRDTLETRRHALPEIVMRRLSAVVSDAKRYFVFMDKTRGEHDRSVLLDDLERYEVIFFEPYWIQIKMRFYFSEG